MATSALFQMQTDRRPLGSTNLPLIRIWCVFFAILWVLPWNSSARADLPQKIQISGNPGPYSKKNWKNDWPGCQFEGGIEQGRVSVVARDTVPWLRVNLAVGEIGPSSGGAGWRMPIGKNETAELAYTLRFSKDFDFVKGGKLPGLCGGPENVSGGRPADGTNGFSARLMWRKDGRGEAYVYHKNQQGNYGDSFPFPADFRFPADVPVQVRISLTMNTPGRRDGSLQVWIGDKVMVEQTNLEWRSVDSFGVDGLYFEVFHGGGDKSWAPKRPCFIEFSEISVSKKPGR